MFQNRGILTRGDSGKNIIPIPRISPGTICNANGTRHEAALWPVHPFGPTSVLGLNVRELDDPPVYAIFGAHLVPPI